MVFAHGLGGAQDLPIPLGYAATGAGVALAVSFLVLAAAWRTPRFDAATQGRPLPPRLAAVLDGPALAWALRMVGVAFTGYVAWAATAGPDLLINPTFGVVYVLLWVGVVPASLLLGPVYAALNPLRTAHRGLARLLGTDPESGVLTLPGWVGLWPAAAGLLAFTWLELVHPSATYLAPVRLWFAGYAVVVLAGAAVFGERWIRQADPFEVFSRLVGHLCVVGRRADGALVVRSPLRNLDGLPAQPGLVGVVAVLLGSTAFDSFAGSGVWTRLTQEPGVPAQLLDAAALVGFCVVVLVLFAGATMLTGVHEPLDRGRLPGRLAHSLVPIIVGYFVAHYATLLVEQGQQTLVLLSDPLGDGSDYLGTADLQVDYVLSSHPTLLAVLKVGAIVLGHLLAVVAAHDRAVRLLPPRHQLTGQLPLLAVMVLFTTAGLYLLLAG